MATVNNPSDVAPRGGLAGVYLMGVPSTGLPVPLPVLHWAGVVIVIVINS